MNVFIPFITVQPQPPPSHLGNQDFCVKTLPPDFLTMLSRKSDEINGNAQNQRHCQIFFSWERNCGRFYIFCSTPCHGQGLSFVVQFWVSVMILLIKWEMSHRRPLSQKIVTTIFPFCSFSPLNLTNLPTTDIPKTSQKLQNCPSY